MILESHHRVAAGEKKIHYLDMNEKLHPIISASDVNTFWVVSVLP